MRQQRYGRIINFSSISGLGGHPGQANYGAAKAGIAGLTRVVARDLGRYGVTCNAIAPGAATRMTATVPPEHGAAACPRRHRRRSAPPAPRAVAPVPPSARAGVRGADDGLALPATRPGTSTARSSTSPAAASRWPRRDCRQADSKNGMWTVDGWERWCRRTSCTGCRTRRRPRRTSIFRDVRWRRRPDTGRLQRGAGSPMNARSDLRPPSLSCRCCAPMNCELRPPAPAFQ